MAATPGHARGVLLRALVGVLAALALLGSGPVVLAHAAAAPAERGSASAPASPQDAMQTSGTAVVLRPGSLAAVPAPASPGAGLLPGPRPHVAPHLVAEPQSRPPTRQPAAPSVLAAGSRAPPAAVGT